MFVPDQIRSLRTKFNLSQEKFGKRIGLSAKSISAYETGRCTPPIKVLRQMSSVYNENFMQLAPARRDELSVKIAQLESSFIQLKDSLMEVILPDTREQEIGKFTS